jgi:hypothetical protein
MSGSRHPDADTLTGIFAAANSGRYLSQSWREPIKRGYDRRGVLRDSEKNGHPFWGPQCTAEKQKPQASYCLRWSGGRAPRVICAPTFVPPFSSLHPSTLVSYAVSLDAPARVCYWTLVVHESPPACLGRGHATAWILHPKSNRCWILRSFAGCILKTRFGTLWWRHATNDAIDLTRNLGKWQARRKDKLTLQVKIRFLRSWQHLVAFAPALSTAFRVGLRFQIAHSACAFLFRWLRVARFVRHGRI